MPAGFFPIFWFSRALIHLLVITVESTAFTTKKAVYYTVGTRVSCFALGLPVNVVHRMHEYHKATSCWVYGVGGDGKNGSKGRGKRSGVLDWAKEGGKGGARG